MDADDVSSPDRLERQLGLLEGRRDAVLVGSVWEGIDRRGEVVREPDLSRLGTSGFAAPFAHGSSMFRRQAFLRAGGYRPECAYWEDLDLYLRMAAQGRVLVTSTPLYRHRFSETSTRLTSRPAKVEEAVDLMFRCRAVFERGDDYARLLDALPADQGSRRLHPYTFLSIAFISLWSGLRPHALQGLLRRGALRPDLISLKALLWAAWAELSPGSLRWLMQIVLRARNGSRARVIAAAPVTEWRPAPGSGETAFSDCAGTFSSSSGGRAPGASTRFASVPAGYRDS